MKLKSNPLRSTALAGLACLAMALLASCGGGTQIESFAPRRVIAFGDESSLVTSTGAKYTVNGVAFDTAVSPSVPKVPTQAECTANQVWVQQLAYNYGYAFPGCPGTGFNANGVMMAGVGAKVADVSAQVTSFMAGDSFGGNDLVTVMVGVNDIIDAYENSPDAMAAVDAAGTAVGAEVVRITDRGAKVIVSTVPDVGYTPYAISRGATAVAQLSALSVRFNTRLRLKLQDVRDGGRAVGLVLGDELVLSLVRLPASYGLTVIDKGVCTTAVPACDQTTLDATAVATSYGYDWLWADDRHLGGNAQARLGASAVNRARSNPF